MGERPPGPEEHGQEVVGRREQEEPDTAGNSLRENAWVSRRKWTSTTLSSAAKNATAMTTRDRPPGRRDLTLEEPDVQGGGDASEDTV